MSFEEDGQSKTIRQRMAEEELVRERVDEQGNKWRKAYFGGGEHYKNWLAQCRKLGDVKVEEVNSTGYKCFEEAGDRLYRIWVKVEETNEEDLF
jgi:argininosuccinate lyase